MKLAPIILFAYNRPLHTHKTLEALQKNTLAKESELYIFIDGLKEDASQDDLLLRHQLIDVIKSNKWCKQMELFISSHNKGLAASVVEGVSTIIKKYKRVIVLEDDLITSPFFLEYMNNALDKYEKIEQVACISGYVYPLQKIFNKAFFIKGADCWGWATWEAKWELIFKDEPENLFRQLQEEKKMYEFNFNNSYSYSGMLTDRIEGKNQSWAVLWYASSFLQNKLCLYPPQSLVNNIGNDGSGTHSDSLTNVFNSKVSEANLPILPNEIEENKIARKEFELFFRKLNNIKDQTFYIKFKNKVKAILGL